MKANGWFNAWVLATLIATGGLADDKSALLEYEKNTISVFEKSAPSVVFITNKVRRRNVFSYDATEQSQGSGSGFMWDNKGHIVTNYHVIQNANVLTVTLADNTTHKATIVGIEPSKDIAVLKIDLKAAKLKPLPLGSSKNLKVGQKVSAIGNPFGLDQTLTVGIVSAIGREITAINNRKIHNVIQTDAAINPGNSGGPLIDSSGKLIGINTAIISRSGGSAGIGFAVPVDTVKRIVPKLIKDGVIIRPGLGVTIIDDYYAKRWGVKGVIVGRVQPGSSAATAGLKGTQQNRRGEIVLGDVIVKVNDNEVKDFDSLAYAMEQCKIGETVTVELIRDNKRFRAKVKLQRVN